jgi:putative FmdB family regulatory protein
MPFYEYECQNCKFYTELMQKISDPPLEKCPSCGKNTMQKLISAPVFRLKGDGWYETDFKGDNESKRNLADADKEKEKEAKSTSETTPAESKTEASPAPAAAEAKKTPSAAATVSKRASPVSSGRGGARVAAKGKAKPAAKAAAGRSASKPKAKAKAKGKAKKGRR